MLRIAEGWSRARYGAELRMDNARYRVHVPGAVEGGFRWERLSRRLLGAKREAPKTIFFFQWRLPTSIHCYL